jgi:hypothetical protein
MKMKNTRTGFAAFAEQTQKCRKTISLETVLRLKSAYSVLDFENTVKISFAYVFQVITRQSLSALR